MRIYEKSCSLTIKERIEQIISNRPKNASDIWVNVYDNSTEYSPENFGFWINDYEYFKDSPVLNYRIDSENKTKHWNFGFTHIKKDWRD